MKGISPIIAEILLVGLVIGLMSSFYLFYQSSTGDAMGLVEDTGETSDCTRYSSIMIVEVDDERACIRNNGATIIDSSSFSLYLNDAPLGFGDTDEKLSPGEEINLTLDEDTSSGDRLKILGDCETGDEYYVR